MADLNTFEGCVDWIETEILPAIKQNYDRVMSTFSLTLNTLDDDGEVLPEVTPRPILVEDSDLTSEEEQQMYAEFVRQILEDYASSGIVTIVFAPNQYHEDRVIVSLEHKGGRVNWAATESLKRLMRLSGMTSSIGRANSSFPICCRWSW